MTQDQVLETHRVMAAIRDDLRLIEGTTDAEKLAGIAKEKTLHMIDGLGQLARLLWSTVPQPRTPGDWSGSGRAGSISKVIGAIEMGMIQIYAPTEMLERRPEYKAKLVEAVAKHVPRIRSALDEVNLLL
jgi:hypothetical protein